MSVLTPRSPAAPAVPPAFADWPQGPYITDDGPMLADLLDQAAGNVFRVDLDAVADVVTVISDPRKVFRAEQDAEVENRHATRNLMGVPATTAAGHNAARRRAGLPSTLRLGIEEQRIEWPAGVPESWRHWRYSWFMNLVGKAESAAATRRLHAQVAATTRRQHRCRVCGSEGGATVAERNPRRSSAEVPYSSLLVWACVPCMAAVRAVLAERALAARTDDGRSVRALAEQWLDAN